MAPTAMLLKQWCAVSDRLSSDCDCLLRYGGFVPLVEHSPCALLTGCLSVSDAG
jgi:hypothetical protein